MGNVRLYCSDTDDNGAIDPGTEILDEKNYYPFGLKHKGYNHGTSSLGNSVAQRWKYNGKEHDESLDINTYDFGARN
ncbi:YD repeat-/RHS repeat-containing protein, partial [Galbibacter marinus]